jgi:16S rRNA (uracil1498-N3)-methyltransferase
VKHRLYLPAPIHAEQSVELDRERTHYLIRVLRLRRGEAIEVFDGAGHAWSASLASASSRSATLAIGPLLQTEAEPAPRLHLVQGLLKGASMDLVVQKATELGATDLWPVTAERSNVPTDAERRERKLQHWQKVMESAAEQCRALHLPRLHPIHKLERCLDALPDAALLLLDPGAPPLPVTLARAETAVLIGPEGGWSDAERRLAAKSGAHCHGLGTRVLRGETAPLAVLAALRHGWGWT